MNLQFGRSSRVAYINIYILQRKIYHIRACKGARVIMQRSEMYSTRIFQPRQDTGSQAIQPAKRNEYVNKGSRAGLLPFTADAIDGHVVYARYVRNDDSHNTAGIGSQLSYGNQQGNTDDVQSSVYVGRDAEGHLQDGRAPPRRESREREERPLIYLWSDWQW